jgi:glycosyl transferase family 2
MLISIIIPVFDRRSTAWKAFESALTQTLDRPQYEIVAVVGTSSDEDAHLPQLLQRCDTVVSIDADSDSAASEIHFYIAGQRAAKGDVLYFVEGHTELLPDCCANIAAYFRAHPDSAVAWAPRINRNRTRLGAIIGQTNLRAEAVAQRQGWFSLGANCVITKSLFAALGGFDPRYFRGNENALFERIRQQRIPIGRIETPLVVHDNDMPRKLLIDSAFVAGAGKFNWCRSEQVAGNIDGPASRRYRVYRHVSHPSIAWILDPAFRVLGHATLFLATGVCRLNLALACVLYVTAQRSFSASGFCRARRASAKRRAGIRWRRWTARVSAFFGRP